MPKEFHRTDRLSGLMLRELATLIQQEVKDPRLGLVTISSIQITRDLAYAKVYVTIYCDKKDIKQNLKTLNHAAGFLRSQLAKKIDIRKMPELIFVYDDSVAEGNRIESLIKNAIAEDEKKFGNTSEEDENE